jgi:hypothetical protein
MLSRERMVVAATASGGETMAPSTKAAAQGTEGTISFSVNPTASVVTITSPIASRPIERIWDLKSLQEVSSAAW